MWLLETLILLRVGMMNEAVLPVPFFALARMSLPDRAIGIACSWIGLGLSKPAV